MVRCDPLHFVQVPVHPGENLLHSLQLLRSELKEYQGRDALNCLASVLVVAFQRLFRH